MSTICALSTPRGKGGIAVIRISGEDALDITAKTIKTKKKIKEMKGYTVTYGTAFEEDTPIDECLVTVFLAPNSFTGENVCEISCHGSMVGADKIIKALIKNGADFAQKGEFTKRAFLNGKVSLTQAEAVKDIIESKTDRALYAAVNRLEGGVAKPIINMREKLLDLLASIQASTDFPDEDIDSFAGGKLTNILEKMLEELDGLMQSAKAGEALNNGIVCAICGIPNTGKSSLLNALLNKDKAIVTDIAGTTRDVVEDFIDIEGIAVKFGDTAGIRASDDAVEAIGVEKSYNYMESADICIFVTECGRELTQKEKEILEKISEKKSILVENKTDLSNNRRAEYIPVCAKNNIGTDAVKRAIKEHIGKTDFNVFVANERQYEAVVRSREAIKRALETASSGFFSDLAAIDIHEAIAALGEAEGISINQETVDRIFEKFCLGK